MLNFCDNNLTPHRPLGSLSNILGCFHCLPFTFRLLVGIMPTPIPLTLPARSSIIQTNRIAFGKQLLVECKACVDWHPLTFTLSKRRIVVRSQYSYGLPNPILFNYKTDNTPDNTLNPHSRQWPIGVNIVHIIAPIMLNLIACANTAPVFLSRKVPIDNLLNR